MTRAVEFQGNAESDRSFLSVKEIAKSNLIKNLKTKDSKQVFEQFMTLNTELITIKHYQVSNQTAL